jgi:universal stress protein E
MRAIKRILVAIKDPSARSLPALAKAAQLAQALDAQLLQAGGELARLLHGSLQIFHAFMPLVSVEPALMAAAPLVMIPPELEDTHVQQVTRAIGQLARKAEVSRARCHTRMGEVADELSAFARRSGSAIVVMGAVSRSAIKRLFIGSVAERALDRLSCDVLIVKPRGFAAATRARAPRALARRPRSTAVAIPPIPPPFL